MVALALLGTACSIAFAYALAKLIALGFEGVSLSHLIGWFQLALVVGIIKALTIWLQEWLAVTAANRAKVQLRAKLFRAIERLGARWLQRQSSAELNLLATSGLDALDAYFARFLPQLVYAALAMPIFVMVVWWADLTSGITLLATLPLIPLFMVLIGWVTQSVQNQQLDAMTRLSKHFLEVVRGLTTLRVFGRTKAQLATIASVSDDYRKRTMKVLRVSFLSGFALELIASLSVALIAVTIGLRLVNAEMTFFAGLFVLLLAPDAYLPLRQVGLHFHASTEGVAASKRVLDIIEEPTPESVVVPQTAGIKFAEGEITALVGPSGVGKSSLMHELLGLASNQEPAGSWLGATASESRAKVAWMPQRPMLVAGSILHNIVGPTDADKVDSALAQRCLELAGADGLSLETEVGESGRSLSGGQAARVSLARALYRLHSQGCDWLWLDEPTASMDSRHIALLGATLQQLKQTGKSIVVITHDDALIALADRVIEVANV